jgi:hypothetical protein
MAQLDIWVSLTYIVTVKTRPITVAETQAFARSAERIWSEDERTELVDFVAHNPEAGAVIPGTGGVRKLRWARSGSGRRGGARVVYFYYRPDCPLYLLLVYAKAQAADLNADEKKAVATFAATIKATVD